MSETIEIGGKLEIEQASIVVNKIDDINNSNPTWYSLNLLLNIYCSIGGIEIKPFKYLVKHQLNESYFKKVREIKF